MVTRGKRKIMNNEYVGAGPVSAQIDINKFNANAVAARIARPNKNKSNAKGITLIAFAISRKCVRYEERA